jgi:hypothetical protein
MTEADERWTFDGASIGIWRRAPSLAGCRTAALGDFSCDDAEHGAHALRQSAVRLRDEGFEALLGPMNGSTWATYRFVVQSDGRPPFLMEPTNPPWYPHAFDAAGFDVVAHYFSAIRAVDHPLSATPPPAGIRVRSLRLEQFDDELRRCFDLALQAFSGNAFYTPISEQAFVASYQPVRSYIDPTLVLMAEDAGGRLQGFLFGLPNLSEGAAPESVILKTYASLHRGCGSLLANTFHRRAREAGYRQVIHALIHTENLSGTHSQRSGGTVFRRYALWGRRL